MSELAAKSCVPCRGGIPPLSGEKLRELAVRLGDGWEVVSDHHLSRRFVFDDFAAALDLANRIGAIAEREGHHPDLCLGWGYVDVRIWTHKIDGLTESDFILAAKISAIAP